MSKPDGKTTLSDFLGIVWVLLFIVGAGMAFGVAVGLYHWIIVLFGVH